MFWEQHCIQHWEVHLIIHVILLLLQNVRKEMGLNQKVLEEVSHKKKDDLRLIKEIENKLKF